MTKKDTSNSAVAKSSGVKKRSANGKPQPPRVSTHGFTMRSTDEAGVRRSFGCFLFADGGYGLDITTEAPGIEPITTRVGFTREGFALLAEAVLHAQHNMHNYPQPKAQGGTT